MAKRINKLKSIKNALKIYNWRIGRTEYKNWKDVPNIIKRLELKLEAIMTGGISRKKNIYKISTDKKSHAKNTNLKIKFHKIPCKNPSNYSIGNIGTINNFSRYSSSIFLKDANPERCNLRKKLNFAMLETILYCLKTIFWDEIMI